MVLVEPWLGTHPDGGPGAGKMYSSVLARYSVEILKVHGMPAEHIYSAGVSGPNGIAEVSLDWISARTDEPEPDDFGDMAPTSLSSTVSMERGAWSVVILNMSFDVSGEGWPVVDDPSCET